MPVCHSVPLCAMGFSQGGRDAAVEASNGARGTRIQDSRRLELQGD